MVLRWVLAPLMALVVLPSPALADTLVLPAPVGTIPVPLAAFPDRPERLRTSSVPGPLTDTERIDVQLGPDGSTVGVVLEHRLDLTGTGDFAIRVRGTALDAEALDGTPAPVLQRGAVVWQGFVPGRRQLAARITLDPLVEGPRLPLEVQLRWAGPGSVGPDGALPGDGVLTVRLVNRTGRPDALPAGDAPAAAVAGPMDALLRHTSGPPPMAGRGLPKSLTAAGVGRRDVRTYAPLRVAGSVKVTGAASVAVTGPGTTPLPDGGSVAGVLAEAAEMSVAVTGGGTFALDLDVVPALDRRLLEPPSGATWSAWAATNPGPAVRQAAVDQLVFAAALAARTDEYAPYFGHHGPGQVSTAFRYRLAPPVRIDVPEPPLDPRPLPIALALLGLVAASGGAVAVWRRL